MAAIEKILGTPETATIDTALVELMGRGPGARENAIIRLAESLGCDLYETAAIRKILDAAGARESESWEPEEEPWDAAIGRWVDRERNRYRR